MRRLCSITLVIVLLALVGSSSSIGFAMGCPKAEREALLKLKHSLIDPANRLSSWKGHDCCHWVGVSCNNATGHVHSLDLRNDIPYNSNIMYSIEYADEAHVYFLELRYLDSKQPDPNYPLYRKSELILDISNKLSARSLGPSLAELKQLRYLDLSVNNFSGIQIPEAIGSLKHLRYLNLSRAWFGGIVPPSLGNLTRLRALDLRSDWFASLAVCKLHWVSELLNLQSLDLGGISLTDAQDSLQALGKLPYLSSLRLDGCELGNTRWLSHAFFNSTWLFTLEYLDLSSNNFEGPLPHFLANMSSLRFLDLTGNYFEGSVPLWLRYMRALESIKLDHNSFSHVEGGTVMGVIGNPCKLKSLSLSWNSDLQGEIAGPHDNFSTCITYDLESLDLGGNSLTGTLPFKLGKLTSLKYLDLGKNRFQGPIPTSIGNLSSLEVLDLGENYVDGSIPPSLGGL